MKSLNQVGIRYLKEQKKRTILTIIGIIISVAMISSIGTMIYSLEQYEYQKTIERNGYNHGAYVEISKEQYQHIKNNVKLDEVAKSSLAGTSFIENESGSIVRIELMGYETRYLELRNMLPVEGRLPENKNEIVLERWKISELGIELGDEINLPVGHFKQDNNILARSEWVDEAVFHESTMHSFKLVGILDSDRNSQRYANSRAIVELNWAEGINDTGKSTVVFRVKNGLNLGLIIENIAMELELGQENVQYNYNLINREQGEINPTLIAIAAFLIGLVCVATVAVIYNAFHISVLERIKQFGIMRSIGTTPRQIKSMVLTEATILSIIAIPIGLASGFYATKLLFYLLSMGEFSSVQGINIVSSPQVLIGSGAIAMVAVYLSAISPAISAGGVSPLDAIFQHRSLKKEAKTRNGFLVGKLFGSEGLLAYKNLQRNKKRLIITAFSISISVIMFIVFSVFSYYAFRINDNLFGYNSDFQMHTYSSDALFTNEDLIEIEALEGLKEIVPLRNSSVFVHIAKDKVKDSLNWFVPSEEGYVELYNSFIRGYDSNQFELLNKELQRGSLDQDAANGEQGVIVIQNSMRQDGSGKLTISPMADLNIGDIIQVEQVISLSETNEARDSIIVPMKVLAIIEKAPVGNQYPYYGGIGLITTQTVYEDITGKFGYDSIYINIEEDADYAHIASTLNSIMDKYPGAGIFDSIASNKREQQTILEISVLIYGFITLISLIGALNIINTISTNLITRTKEFGMLRAVGMSPKSMRKMIRLEAIFSSITGTVFGLVLGNGLAIIYIP